MTAFWVGVVCFVAYQIGKQRGRDEVKAEWVQSLANGQADFVRRAEKLREISQKSGVPEHEVKAAYDRWSLGL